MSHHRPFRADSRIDEYGPHHVADMRADGTLYVLDADRTVTGVYQPFQWTILPRRVARNTIERSVARAPCERGERTQPTGGTAPAPWAVTYPPI